MPFNLWFPWTDLSGRSFSSDDAVEAITIIDPETHSRSATVGSIMSNLLSSCMPSGFILMLWVAQIMYRPVTGWLGLMWADHSSRSIWGMNNFPPFLCICVVLCLLRGVLPSIYKIHSSISILVESRPDGINWGIVPAFTMCLKMAGLLA
jgi:hypothetical protein